MATVHTEYGPGQIVASETVRGRKQYKVAGDFGEVWLDETKVAAYGPVEPGGYDDTDPLADIISADEAIGGGAPAPMHGADDPRYYEPHRHEEYWSPEELAALKGRYAYAPMDLDNSVALPYDPEPQYPAIPGDTESTIQPIHEIDADERLSPADSITFDDERDDEGGIDPHGDNFADAGTVLASRREANPALLAPLVRGVGMGLAADALGGGGGHDEHGGDEGGGLLEELRVGPGFDPSIYVGSQHEAGIYDGVWDPANDDPDFDPHNPDAETPYARDFDYMEGLTPDERAYVGPTIEDRMGPPQVRALNAALGDKYIELTADVDHYSPEAQFRHDPAGYINRVGHVLTAGHEDHETESYASLVEANKQIREAAWKDVRAKAMRLRREGRVKVKEITADAIYTAVNGDNGNYEVMIYKGGSFQGLGSGGSSSIGAWTCSCPWGKWAFKRQRTFVGRLCSHGYASYLEMQSAHLNGKPSTRRQTKLPRVKRQGGIEVQADALQNVPQRLVPDLTVNDTDDEHLLVDLTEDERDTTDPEGIVHFSHVRSVDQLHTSHLNRTDIGMTDVEIAILRAAAFARQADDQTTQDWKVEDTGDAKAALEEIREIGERPQEEDFGDMASRAEAVRNAVDEARENGVDASYLVASLRTAAPDDDPGHNSNPPGLLDNANLTQGRGWRGLVDNAMGGDYFRTHGPGGTPLNRDTGAPVSPPTQDAVGQGTPAAGFEPVGAGGSDGGTGQNSPGAPGSDFRAGPGSTGPGTSLPGYNSSGMPESAGAAGAAAGGQPAAGAPANTNSIGWSRNENADAIGGDNYEIRSGDTLSDIATRAGYGDNYQGLADQLGIADPNKINAGDTLDFTKATQGRDLGTAKGIGTGKGLDTGGDSAGSDSSEGADGGSGFSPLGLGGEGGSTDSSGGSGFSGLGLGGGSVDLSATGGGSGGGGAETGAATSAASNPADPAAISTPSASNPSADKEARRRMAMPGDGGSAYGDQPMPGEGKNMDVYSDQGSMPYPEVPGETKNSLAPNSLPANPGELGTGQGVRLPDYGDIAGPIAGGVGGALTGIGGALPGLPPLHGNYLTAAQIEAADYGDDDFLEVGGHHPFAGSGWPGNLEVGTSADYVEEHERPHFQDVTDIDGVIKHVDNEPHHTAGVQRLGKAPRAAVVPEVVREQRPNRQRGAAVEHLAEFDDYDPLAPRTAASFDDDAGDDDARAIQAAADTDDIVAQFQRSAGAQAVMASNAGGGGKSDDDIAGAAAAFLRTAGRNYSLAEQDELINERHASGARNLDQLDLANTHYSQNSVGLL